jgi:hypothetical protein
MTDCNKDVEILTKLVQKCSDEKNKKFGFLNKDEMRALDELVHTSSAEDTAKLTFWGAALDYRSKMVAHGKY